MKPCPRDSNNFDTCVLQMASNAMSYILVKGQWKEIGTLDPAPGNSIHMKVKSSDLLLLQFTKDHFLWRGLKNTAIRNLKYDLVHNILSFDLDIPSLKVDTPVNAKGHILNTQINTDENTSPPVVMHFVSVEFTASFSIRFIQKANASGLFLFPYMKTFDITHNTGSGTLKFENLLPADYSPDVRSQQLLKQAEEVGAAIVAKLTYELIPKMVMEMTTLIMQMNTYDQFFPENELAAAQNNAGVAMTLTGSWLAVIAVYATVLLLGIWRSSCK